MTTYPDLADAAASLSPADGETRSFLITTMKRASLTLFTVACDPAAMMSCGLQMAWHLYGPVGDWLVGELRTLPVPIAIEAQWSNDDGWHIAGKAS